MKTFSTGGWNGLRASLLVGLTAVLLVGCSGPRMYIHPSPGLDRIRRVAVLPFENNTKEMKAAERVRTQFVIELLRLGYFDVVDPGEVDRKMQAQNLSYEAGQELVPPIRTAEKAEETEIFEPLTRVMGEVLGVEAILVGSVDAYSANRVGDRTVPEVAISARLLDAETGIIIWAATHSRRGRAGLPFLGWGRITSLSDLSQKVVEAMVQSLAEYAP